MSFPRSLRTGSHRLARTALHASAVLCLALQPIAAQTAPIGPPAPPAQSPPPVPTQTRPVTAAHRAEAERLYLRGARELEAQHYPEAEATLAHAASLDPTRPEPLQALALAREHRISSLLSAAAGARALHPAEADRLLAEARSLDPQNPRILQHDIAAAPSPARTSPLLRATTRTSIAGPLTLQPTTALQSFHLRSDTRAIAQSIATAYGLTAAMDADLPIKPLRLDVDDVDFPTAIHIFSLLSNTFSIPLTDHSVLIAEDSAANRTRLEHLIEEDFPLPGYSTEQITDAANMVRSIFDLKQVSFEPQAGVLAIRAPRDMLAVIDSTLTDLLDTGNEVFINVKLYSVDFQKTRNFGVQLPQSLGAFSVSSEATGVVSQNQSLVNQLIANGVIPAGTSNTVIAAYLVFVAGVAGSSALKNTFLLFGGGRSQTGLTAGSFPVLNIALQQSEARALDDVQLRVADRTSATVKSGTRYPIQTSVYSNLSTTSTNSSLSALLAQYTGGSSLGSAATVPQIQYQDLGLTLKAEPHVHRDGSIAMHLDLKLEALTGSAINGLPILASRQFTSDLTIQDGGTALLSSNVTESELRATSGIPGLSELPGFQSTTNRNTQTVRGNLVVVITPHLVRHAHILAKGPYLPLDKRPETE